MLLVTQYDRLDLGSLSLFVVVLPAIFRKGLWPYSPVIWILLEAYLTLS